MVVDAYFFSLNLLLLSHPELQCRRYKDKIQERLVNQVHLVLISRSRVAPLLLSLRYRFRTVFLRIVNDTCERISHLIHPSIMNKCSIFMFVVICAFVVQPGPRVVDAQSTNFFSNFFTIFRRASRQPGSSKTNSSTSKLSGGSINQWSSAAEPQVKTITMTMTETETSEMMVTSTMSEFFTITETITERLIATSTLTRKMTATATQIVTSCPVQDIGLRRINWKEIPNRIEEIMKRSGVPA